MAAMLMQPIYLYVAPEEYPEVQSAGAAWDGTSKRWYLPEGADAADFTRWLGGDAGDAEFGVSSEKTFVVSAPMACMTCQAEIEVIALYCELGFDEETGEAIERVTVSNVWAINEGLRTQLEQYPFFKRIGGPDAGTFANHCAHCGAVQEEYRLHSEPGDVFFSVTEAQPGSVTFTPIEGLVRMSGDFGFGV